MKEQHKNSRTVFMLRCVVKYSLHYWGKNMGKKKYIYIYKSNDYILQHTGINRKEWSLLDGYSSLGSLASPNPPRIYKA